MKNKEFMQPFKALDRFDLALGKLEVLQADLDKIGGEYFGDRAYMNSHVLKILDPALYAVMFLHFVELNNIKIDWSEVNTKPHQ